MSGTTGGKAGDQQIGANRSAAVMHEASDGVDTELAHTVESVVEGLPIAGMGEALPMYGVAEGVNTEIADEVEIGEAAAVAGAIELVEEGVAHAIDRGFDATPQLERMVGHVSSRDRGGHQRFLMMEPGSGETCTIETGYEFSN